MKKTVTFGEIMLRLSPPGNLRFSQAAEFGAEFGGAEVNVAVSLANFGLPVEYLTRLPANDLAESCLQQLRGYGVGLQHVLRGGERLGIYFLEKGAAQRGSKVLYDRAHSSFSTIEKGMFDWHSILKDAAWFHWTGITPAVSSGAAAALEEGLEAARKMGLMISCDLNYRANLWNWGKDPRQLMLELAAGCDYIIGNMGSIEKFFGLDPHQAGSPSADGELERCRSLCESLKERLPDMKAAALTLRGSLSASHTTWSAVLWRPGEFLQSQIYNIDHIVERVGGGDAFAAGLIYALQTHPHDNQGALEFAAAACLKHSIYGDFNLVTLEEVEKLMRGDCSGRISR
jgi:2-dehydro-3-deoxygluconokinase